MNAILKLILLETIFILFYEKTEGQTLCERYDSNKIDILWSSKKVSHIGSKGVTIIAKTINIKNELIIDAPIEFIDCIFRMEANSKIKFIKQSAYSKQVRMDLENCKLFSCGGTWNGISTYTGSLFISNNTEIENATTAITCGSASILDIQDSKIAESETGIDLAYRDAVVHILNNLINTTEYGIKANGVRIETGSFENNTLSGMKNAMKLANQAEVHSSNNIFNDAKPDPSLVEFGCAIYSENSSFYSTYDVFHNMTKAGIWATGILGNSEIKIYDCIFNNFHIDSKYCIYVNNIQLLDIQRTNIEMEGSAHCIRAIDVKNEVIVMNTFGNSSNKLIQIHNGDVINISNSKYFPSVLVESCNIFHGSGKGIYAYGVGGENLISNNTISKLYQINTTFDNWGIGIVDCMDSVLIRNNKIQQTDPMPQELSGFCGGIHIESSPLVNLCDNEIDYSRYGIHIKGVNTNFQMSSNQLKHHGIGLHLENASIPNQVRRYNVWSKDTSDYRIKGAVCNNCKDSLGNFYNRIKVNLLASPEIPPSYEPEGWFEEEMGRPNSCDIRFRGILTEFNNPIHNDLVATSQQNPNLTKSNQTEALMQTLELLTRDPTLRMNNPILETFYTQQLLTDVGKLHLMENQMADFERTSVDQNSTYYQIFIQLQNSEQQLSLLNQQLIQTPALVSNAFFMEQFFDQLQDYHSLKDQLLIECQNIETARFSLYADLLSELEAYSFTGSYEENLRIYWILFLNWMLQGQSFTSTQYQQLENLAYLCPHDGGRAVYCARRHLPASVQEVFAEHHEYCSANNQNLSSYSKANKEELHHQPILNGAEELSSSEPDLIQLLDLNGRTLETLSTENYSLGLQQLKEKLVSGMYILRLEYQMNPKRTKFITFPVLK